MNDIQTMATINYMSIAITVLIILFGVKQIFEIFSYYKNKFRIKTGRDTDKEELDNKIKKLEEHDEWQYNEILKISKGIDDLKKSFLDSRINSMRYEILDMANAISCGRKYKKENFDHIIDVYRAYEELLKENGLTNGQVTLSMEVITDTYKECLKNGF